MAKANKTLSKRNKKQFSSASGGKKSGGSMKKMGAKGGKKYKK